MGFRAGRPGSVLSAFVAVALTAGACGRSEDSQPAAGKQSQVRLYGTDGNMSNSFGAALTDHPGILAGMKGTTPLTDLSEDFKRRLRGIDPNLRDFNYGGEAYDAMVVAALAAETARSTEGREIAKFITSVTVGRDRCGSYRECLDALRAGRDIAYRGVSLRSGLTEAGEPSTASYGTLNFGRDNRIEDGKTEYVGAGSDSGEAKNVPAPPPAAPPGAGGRARPTPNPLRIGVLLPRTGALASQSPPMFAAVQLATNEINQLGVLGAPLEIVDGDDGTSPQVAAATLDRHIAAGVQVVIGSAASGVSAAVLPKAVAAGRVMISPSATSDALSNVDDKGLFFRTAPPDLLQAKAVADIIMRDGSRRIALVARNDSYGTGLANNIQADLVAAGVPRNQIKVVQYAAKDSYEGGEAGTTFGPVAGEVRAHRPEAVVIIGFDESAHALRALLNAGVKPLR